MAQMMLAEFGWVTGYDDELGDCLLTLPKLLKMGLPDLEKMSMLLSIGPFGDAVDCRGRLVAMLPISSITPICSACQIRKGKGNPVMAVRKRRKRRRRR
ncbi:hypothetical protein ACLOJK_028106 [Asimina triloba]